MMNIIFSFFDNIFIFYYCKMRSKDIDPEITPIFIISYGQSANLVSFYIFICFFFDLYELLSIKYFAVLSYFFFSLLNVLVYLVFKRKDKLNIDINKSININQTKIYLYIFISLIIPIILILIKVNFLNGF